MTTTPVGGGRRAYRSPRRQQQAAETRAVVLAAADTLFATKGWSATGMRDVAREALRTVAGDRRCRFDLLVCLAAAIVAICSSPTRSCS